MTIFIKTKLKKSDDQTIIDKYRVSCFMKINLLMNYYSKIHEDKAIISCNKCLYKYKKSTCLLWMYGLFGHNH